MKTLRHVTFYFILFSLLCAITTLSESAPGGFCQVGDVLSPGQSCTDGGTGDDFTVIGGRGQYGFINAATEINLKGNINGKERNFHAKKRADGNWEILSVSAGGELPEPPIEPPVTTVKRVVSASVVSPLTEATLDGSTVTLLLTAAAFEQDISKIRDAVTVSGIKGVTIDTATLQRINDRKVTIELKFDGTDLTSDTSLLFNVADGAITNHKGSTLTAEIRVTANTDEALLKIYWVEFIDNKIQRANLDGSSIEDLVSYGPDTNTYGSSSGIALDVLGGKMYWVNDETGKIQRANLDGSNMEDLLTPGQGVRNPFGIALDVSGGKIYWTDFGIGPIKCANLDGSNIEDLVTYRQGLIEPRGIALDVSGGKMYWADQGTEKIQRANLDGSNIEDLLTGLKSSRDIALDVSGGKMYWTIHSDGPKGKIQRANLDGSNIEDLLTGLDWPSGIALDVSGGKMYWADFGIGPITCANLDGSNIEDVVPNQQGAGWPDSIAISIVSPVVPPSSPKPAWDVNGDGMVDGKDIDALITAIVDGITDAKYDVNGDGKVDINDVVAVNANRDAEGAGAPARLGDLKLSAGAVNRLQEQIDLLIATGDRSPAAVKTLIYLQQLIATETRPEKTQLLANYPNPFNPETWIPYQLSKSAEVRLTIYAVDGHVVRTLALGHQAAGVYQSRSRAAYWDGRNAVGEPVASGLYFYTLRAGDFSATRKMLIRK